ncbi:LysR family transcriptional regulator [Bradyrhizobium huanghuaihaiense]|uniref:LysR family transcriptional regulator n=1 Tax=Bradyrhizobium huanghuaihaiense TaxID=990078 RepID=UPI003221D02A
MSSPVLDPDLLKAFAAVAEHRSFTRAATTLNRTQSAVSVQIRRLEERLGAKLFQRTRAGVVLTPAGDELLVYAKRLRPQCRGRGCAPPTQARSRGPSRRDG